MICEALCVLLFFLFRVFAVMTDDYGEEVFDMMNGDWECEGKKEKGEIQDSPFSETPISFSKNRFA